jgi:hypothetical protein
VKATHIVYERSIAKDGYACRVGVLKSLYRVARRKGELDGLRDFAKRCLTGSEGPELKKAAEIWTHNKRVNPTSDLKGIGSTKKKKGGQGGGKK